MVTPVPLRSVYDNSDLSQNVEQGLPQFAKYPICLVWGMHDWCFTPAFLERFEQFYPEAESHRLDAGHYVVEDAFEQIEPILESFFEHNPVF